MEIGEEGLGQSREMFRARFSAMPLYIKTYRQLRPVLCFLVLKHGVSSCKIAIV